LRTLGVDSSAKGTKIGLSGVALDVAMAVFGCNFQIATPAVGGIEGVGSEETVDF